MNVPDTDKNAILIRALEASGSEREAQLARAILGDPAAVAAAPEVPATPAAAPAAAEEQSEPTLAELEALGTEKLARVDPAILDEALRREG